MTYPTAENISEAYASNHWVMNRLLDGLSHSDSLVQPAFDGNCLNWVLGHIVKGRNTALKLLEAEPVFSAEMVERFKTGSPPVSGEGDSVAFEKLTADLNTSQERITAALAKISPEALALDKTTSRGTKPVGQHLSGLAWHETYHTGQIELFRSIALEQRD